MVPIMTKGFICPECHSDQVGVIQTMNVPTAVQRRRKCFICAATFHTFEIHADLISTDPKFDFLFRKAEA